MGKEALQTILLVEDDRLTRDTVAAILESEGYDVVETRTASHAAVELGGCRPDLVILDLGLPDRDGIDFLRECRAWSNVPVLVLSARTQESSKVDALEAGADDYVTKPYGAAELVARVRAILRRPRPDQADAARIIRFGACVIDCASRSVERHGEAVYLTDIEYRLLAFLAANPGRLLTYRQLLTHIWGVQAADHQQYLRVYVGHLRQKIEDEPVSPRHILTEVGVGYRFRL